MRTPTKQCLICKATYKKRKTCSKKEWSRSKYCSQSCQHKGLKGQLVGSKNPNYKTGKTITKNGYIQLSLNGGKIYEHRKVMQDFLGRKLDRNEIVHHKDGDKLNNDISNLEVLTNSQHSKLHYPKGSMFGINQIMA